MIVVAKTQGRELCNPHAVYTRITKIGTVYTERNRGRMEKGGQRKKNGKKGKKKSSSFPFFPLLSLVRCKELSG